nr:RNA-directed DNA polymerase, eukaryota [Tanacetum cinerariifolium]
MISELGAIDKVMDRGIFDDDTVFCRFELKHKLLNVSEMESKDNFKKSKVKWVVEGDENSKFFHGIINKRRAQLAIRGIFVDGFWETDPDLERSVSRDEIRRAVWSCSDNKSPGPGGFTFEFFKKYWDCIGSDFCEAVEYFFVNNSFPKGCNSFFVALIPKVMDAKFVNDFRLINLIESVYKVVTKTILDGPFILDEILHWCKRKNKKAMFFKVDFAKAYDSVRWDYLLEVLEACGFGRTWCNWIQGTLISAKASILINRSPSKEYSCHRGLKQEDPLYLNHGISPFIFNRVVDEGLFKGIQLPGSLSVSHLFYANDVMFIGECDLWKSCSVYGTVNPSKKSKAGKRFAFVRFIKIFNLDRLVENLCTIWIGKFHLFANKVRFERPHKPNVSATNNSGAASRTEKPFNSQQTNNGVGSYANTVNGISTGMQTPVISSSPALVLDDSCLIDRDLSNHVLGKVEEFSSIPNLHTIFKDEGFSDVKVSYIGGLWVLLELTSMDTKLNLMNHIGVKSWFHTIQEACDDFVSDERIVWVDIEGVPLKAWSRETFNRIGKIWGETLDLEENADSSFGRKSLCIKTKHVTSILETFKLIVKGRVYMIADVFGCMVTRLLYRLQLCLILPGYTFALQIADVFGCLFRMIHYTSALQIEDVFGSGFALLANLPMFTAAAL